MKNKFRTFLVPAILALALVGVAAFAQDEWPTFHQNNQRTGAVVNDGTGGTVVGSGVLGAYRPVPIWIFPAPQKSMLIIDNAGSDLTNGYFGTTGGWNSAPLNAAAPFGNDDPLYVFTESVPASDLTIVPNTAHWDFEFSNDANRDWSLTDGTASFYVYIWVPSPGSGETLEHISDAEYSVYLNGTYLATYIMDQRSGGDWQLLTYTSFTVNDGNTLTVKLTNKTKLKDDNDLPLKQLVIADAVLLRADAGIVYGSPVASKAKPILVTAKSENTVTPGASSGVTGTGAVYGLGTEPNSGGGTVDDRGVMVWQYPQKDHDWILGGITSSPAIVDIPFRGECAVIPGQDGQVYVLATWATNQDTAPLIWRGPGYFVDNSDPGYGFSGAWTNQVGAFGRMGGSYDVSQAIPAGSATPSTASWTFTLPADPLKDRVYDVYAWIPPPSGGMIYLTDAKYSELDTATGLAIPSTAVSVRQDTGWVSIRKGYRVLAGATMVAFGFQLSNETNGGTSGVYAVADAMKIVPSGLVAFDKSSPAVDGSGNIYVGSTDWVGTSKGRLYKLSTLRNDPVWMWPDQSLAPVGGFQGSPALSPNGDTVYIGSTDGRLYAVYTATGLTKWVYPDPSAMPAPALLGEITGTPTVVTGSSGKPVIYVGIGGFYGNPSATFIEGRILAIEDGGTQGTLLWQYPGAGALGTFDYVSALLIGNPWGALDPTLVIGSTDGKLYRLTGGGGVPDPAANLAAAITSSAAGTYITYAKRGDITNTARANVPMAFVGAGSRIVGVDVTDGTKDWWWSLMGYTSSSPAVTNSRIYTGDWEGYTWAFSSGLPGGGGAETWNTTLGPEPPTPGSEGTGRDALPKVDIFSKADWEALHKDMEIAEKSGVSTDWKVDSTTFRQKVLDYSTRGVSSAKDYAIEWGEDAFYIVVWDLLDPNKKKPLPKDWVKRFKDDGTVEDLFENYVGKVVVTIRNLETGKAAVTDPPLSMGPVDFFNDAKIETVVGPDEKGYACFYAAKLYSLDASSAGKPQTPGSRFTITAREEPGGGNMSSLDYPVPKEPTTADAAYLPAATTTPDKLIPLEIGINNPIGIWYSGPYGTTAENKLIGVLSGAQTSRRNADADVNGNGSQLPPVIWGGYTPHNKLSDTRTLTVYDRSLLSTTNRRIANFRIQRQDLKWTGGATLINGLPWETQPGDFLVNRANTSVDYPDIDLRQIRCRLVTNGKDPTQGVVELIPSQQKTSPATSTASWTLNGTGVNLAIQVPRFQPPNMPANPGSAPGTVLANCGFTSLVYAYVDSNNNGVCDGLSRQSANAIQQQKLSGGMPGEAYRVLEVQVHVPADYRAQIEDTRVNIGEVPQGFGFTDGAGVPQIFEPTLAPDFGFKVIAPPGFGEWFKPLTVKNTGNVNLKNVGFFRTDLYSDTVQQPMKDASGNWIPGSGFGIPSSVLDDNACMVTTLDLFGVRGAGFKTSVPPVDPSLPRTFHKARVGDNEGPELKIPDFPTWASYPAPVQGPPAVSVAVPLGTPVGTYYGKMHLVAEGGVPVSNTVDVIVTATESRLTDGSTLSGAPHLTHMDPTPLPTATDATPVADAMPAAYRNPATGNVLLFWSSSRYPQTTVPGGGSVPGTSDPWYLYMTKLSTNASHQGWKLAPPVTGNTYQWWKPLDPTSSTFPSQGSVAGFFPGPPADPAAGAPGTIVPGTVRFGSPSVAVDKINGQAYLMFTGQAYKEYGSLMTGGALTGSGTTGVQRRTLESRSYYTEIKNEDVSLADIRSMSPNPDTTGHPMDGDWTTPKFGVRGAVIVRDVDEIPELWSFWYGGGNGKWRIYYSSKLNPANLDPGPPPNTEQWTNEAMLPVPKCLSSVAEPSPIVHVWNGMTGSDFEVVYSGISNYHKNSDIYLSRYHSQSLVQPIAQGGYRKVDLQTLPMRGLDVPEIQDAGPVPMFAEKLTRDATRTTWYSKDIDWLADKATNFEVHLVLNPDPATPVRLVDANDLSINTIYKLNVGSAIKDPSTGAMAYMYDGGTAIENKLKTLFRAVVINPVEGTVKFMKLPQVDKDLNPVKSVLVVARYYPRAYRLTTDRVADASPCALMDDDANPRFGPATTNTDGLPFFIPGGGSGGGSGSKVDPPPTDRLWVFWRRPTMDKPGTGIYYRAQRYMVQLDRQLGLTLTSSGGRDAYSPDIRSIVTVDGGLALQSPVEVDWVKNRLYFTGADSVYTDPLGFPHLRQILVSYTDGSITDKTKNRVDNEPHYIQYADEDMAQTGKTFGNLTSLMVNEGQVNVLKDPGVMDISTGNIWPQNRLWVFWSSTRSGNSDLYYETISPRFFGQEYR